MKFDNAVLESSYGTAKQLPVSDIPEIAFSGRSNVGKSSLLNKILNRKALARVSTKPGKTITINFYKLGDVRLCDLPGYGYAKVAGSERERWSGLMEHYFTTDRNIKLVVQLVDMRHPPSKLDLDMLHFLESAGYHFIIALTKSDKLNKTERKNRLTALQTELSFLSDTVKIIPFSAEKGEGADEIKKEIENAILGDEGNNVII
ncbi:MAG: YihA family ribosome biogenesis GTP-binding protein [Clostridiales bacterium 43-6]|nr:MAG: YihA family ribosome biogenesis GTP-binding protein [Clostridiales bacterium 43-6]